MGLQSWNGCEPSIEKGTNMSQMAEMGRLTKELSQTSEFRKSAIDEMRRATKATLMACATMRGDMMHGYRAQTHKFLASLAKDVAAHRRAATKQIMRVMSARRKASSQMRASLERQVHAIMKQTAEARNAAAEICPALSTAHRKMAKRQRASLDSSRRKLRTDVARFLGSIHADRMNARGIWSAFKLGSSAGAGGRP